MTHTKDEALKLALDGQRHLVEILAENWRVWPAQKAVEQTCLGDVYCSTKGRDLMFGNHEIAVDQDSAVVTKEMWSTMRQTLAAQPAPVRKCRNCDGSGDVSTGIWESPTAICKPCSGTGQIATPPAAQPAIVLQQAYRTSDAYTIGFKDGQAAQPAPVQEILAAFPLFDEQGLDEEKHHCEWTLLQDRKRLHAMLAAPAAQPAPVQPVAWREALERIADPRNTHFAGDAQVVAREALATPPAAAVQEGRDWSLLEATQESLREHMTEIKRLKEAQPAVPLTDEQIEHLWETRVSQPCPRYPLEKADWVQFARAIEAAHGITKGQP